MNKLLAGLAAVLVSSTAMAGTKAFNLSITPEIAVYDRGETIEGVTLSIWGENEQSSLALGIVNGTTGNSAGLSLGILNYAENYGGLQWGLVNCTKDDFTGWQGGFIFGVLGSVVNYTGGAMKGLQSGLVNYAGSLSGVQIGLANYAEDVEAGVQIGIVNAIRQNTAWFSQLPNELAPAMILVNWRF
jgi:hypothetical protein